jgi:hypothetical protein
LDNIFSLHALISIYMSLGKIIVLHIFWLFKGFWHYNSLIIMG